MWPFEVLGALDYCRSAVVVYGAWPKCVLRGCENACGCPGLFPFFGLGLLWSAIVLGLCENLCGCLGLFVALR